jgi:hypothetical protein
MTEHPVQHIWILDTIHTTMKALNKVTGTCTVNYFRTPDLMSCDEFEQVPTFRPGGKPVEKGEEEFNEWMDTNHVLQVITAFKR